ncbi:alpha-ketoglutarate-dependent dioxygenase AlkB [Tuwongella immobilis]|uniref:Fe2OG dioxygenase domain-containing protein n=1 Tax=Tuwongella immobilis TaxID=692036 RepID=A0A6C2YVR7_9BACT|nr:alpha-ketoglutarate-dependent dioxygenase AlkB [Tuwongella immobilis]VIP05079.1 2og-fe oxygenase : 2OG-Fe(II) oxygenase OS=Pseudomonas sp. CMAA1215 GN=P308_12460 PE=4 SV=1: 2OG-FeII_Oxy_2 [Tuwongella immobilis]VTS07514.1 2og-fe oxygenase : 2OG-Fe(II) oxygenase OS=Pseudomonas sp. CMAA1215 GN=P308_12460 PE=4 SV=1: 2OG-FeII_Oxy_2 [Tuwongella immobilis]
MPSPIEEGVALFRPDFWIECDALFSQLVAEVAWDDRIRARRVASFGVPYNYSGTVWPAAPIPTILMPMLAALTDVVGYAPNNCLANYYPTGDSTMGYHADSVSELEPGTGISIVSLGATRAITFRRERSRSEVYELPLSSGSLLHMTAQMQSAWRHAVLRAEGVSAGRISLTFRRIKLAESIAPDATAASE